MSTHPPPILATALTDRPRPSGARSPTTPVPPPPLAAPCPPPWNSGPRLAPPRANRTGRSNPPWPPRLAAHCSPSVLATSPGCSPAGRGRCCDAAAARLPRRTGDVCVPSTTGAPHCPCIQGARQPSSQHFRTTADDAGAIGGARVSPVRLAGSSAAPEISCAMSTGAGRPANGIPAVQSLVKVRARLLVDEPEAIRAG